MMRYLLRVWFRFEDFIKDSSRNYKVVSGVILGLIVILVPLVLYLAISQQQRVKEDESRRVSEVKKAKDYFASLKDNSFAKDEPAEMNDYVLDRIASNPDSENVKHYGLLLANVYDSSTWEQAKSSIPFKEKPREFPYGKFVYASRLALYVDMAKTYNYDTETYVMFFDVTEKSNSGDELTTKCVVTMSFQDGYVTSWDIKERNLA